MRRKQVIPASQRHQSNEDSNYRCRACGNPDVDNLQADHIVPESKGGTLTADNLQCLCGICNNRKGSTDIGELPILPPINPNITWDELQQDMLTRRYAFSQLLTHTRQNEVAELIHTTQYAMRKGTTLRVCLNRIVKSHGRRTAEKIRQAIK